jgi:hypothetical protein
MDARHRIGEALTRFSATLSQDRDQGLPPPPNIVTRDQGPSWVAHVWDRSSDIAPSAGSVSSQASRQNRRHNGTATTPDHVVRQKIALLTVVLRSPPRTVLAPRTGGEGPVDNYRMIQRAETGWSGSFIGGDLSYTPSVAAGESESEPT